MELSIIDEEDFEALSYGKGWTEFQFKDELYRLKLAGREEIVMSVLIYRDVQFFKGSDLMLAGQMMECGDNYNLVSPDNKFIYLPIQGSILMNLETEERQDFGIRQFRGNVFNRSSSKMILNGTTDLAGTGQHKVIDLFDMKEIRHVKEERDKFTYVFFKDDDTTLQIRGKNKLESFNLTTQEKKTNSIKSPFELFDVPLEKYQPLIDANTHCLWMPEGGMRHSESLNTWSFMNTRGKTILQTLIPSSEIKYNEGYNTDFCTVTYKYAELR